MIFYKYTDFNTGLKIIKERKIRFTQPITFNDPFDSAPILNFKNSRNELIELIANKLKENPDIVNLLLEKSATQSYNKLPENIKTLLTNQKLKELGTKYLFDQYGDIKNILNSLDFNKINSEAVESVKFFLTHQTGVFCLSRIEDNLLMWSHYSDSHQGIVIGFDSEHKLFNLHKNDLTKFKKVHYSKNRTIIDINSLNLSDAKNMKIAEKIYFTKSIDWEYESEYRVIKYLEHGTKIGKSDKNGFPIHLFKFTEDTIDSIIFGAKVTKENYDDLLNILDNDTYCHVKMFQASLNEKHYKIDIKEIKD